MEGRPWGAGDTRRAGPPPERTGMAATAARRRGSPFPAVAEAILYRWAVERDTAVSAGEIDQVRAYLRQRGVRTTPLADGRFSLDGAITGSVERARLVLAALRTFVQARLVARGRRLPAESRCRPQWAAGIPALLCALELRT